MALPPCAYVFIQTSSTKSSQSISAYWLVHLLLVTSAQPVAVTTLKAAMGFSKACQLGKAVTSQQLLISLKRNAGRCHLGPAESANRCPNPIGPAVRADFRRLYPANAKTLTCCPSDDNRTKATNSVTSARSLWWHVGPYFWPADLTRTANPISRQARMMVSCLMFHFLSDARRERFVVAATGIWQ